MKKLLMVGVLILGGIAAYGSNKEAESEEKIMPGAMFAGNENAKLKLFLPLKKTDVKLWVSAGIIHAEVSQVFRNNTTHPLEAIYIFPLPSQSTVTNMELRVGDRLIRSIVKEKEEAVKSYNKAKKEGKKAAIITEERPNIFTTSVANFLPGETVEIKLSYIEPLTYSKGCYEVNFPMVVGPRYIPFKIDVSDNGDVDMAAEVSDADKITPPILHPSVDSGHKLTMSVEIEGIPLEEIISNTHSIKVKETENKSVKKYIVTLRNDETIPDSDFNLKLILKKKNTPQISSLTSRDNDTVFSMINIFPPVLNEEQQKKQSADQTPREVIFLIDTSGSMEGESISQAKAGLKQCLQMLTEKDYFTIVRFSSDYSSFSPDLRKARKSTLKAAEGYIDGLSADDGTEMQKALKYILDLPPVDENNMQLIVFLTDGDVGNEDNLIRLISNKMGKRRMFTFGIGSAPNEYLMRKMAEKGRGQSRFIHSHEDIGVVMSEFFKTLETPALTDISLKWIDRNEKEVKGVAVYPAICPDVFYERPLQIFAKYPADTVEGLIVTGKIAGEKKSCKYSLHDGNQSYPAIEKIFAKSAVDQLMYNIIMDPSSTKTMKKKIIDIALKHQLVTKYTSRIAIEEKITKQPDGSLLTVKVPVKLPKGWNGSAFFATSTDNPLLMLIGSVAICISAALQLLKKLSPPLPGAHRQKSH